MRDCKRTSRGDGDVLEHGSRSVCGNEVIKLDTLTEILCPACTEIGSVRASANRTRSSGVHPGTRTFQCSAGIARVTGYGLRTFADAVIKVPSGRSTIFTSSAVKSGITDALPTLRLL
jgi:hypothetical protein